MASDLDLRGSRGAVRARTRERRQEGASHDRSADRRLGSDLAPRYADLPIPRRRARSVLHRPQPDRSPLLAICLRSSRDIRRDPSGCLNLPRSSTSRSRTRTQAATTRAASPHGWPRPSTTPYTQWEGYGPLTIFACRDLCLVHRPCAWGEAGGWLMVRVLASSSLASCGSRIRLDAQAQRRQPLSERHCVQRKWSLVRKVGSSEPPPPVRHHRKTRGRSPPTPGSTCHATTAAPHPVSPAPSPALAAASARAGRRRCDRPQAAGQSLRGGPRNRMPCPGQLCRRCLGRRSRPAGPGRGLQLHPGLVPRARAALPACPRMAPDSRTGESDRPRRPGPAVASPGRRSERCHRAAADPLVAWNLLAWNRWPPSQGARADVSFPALWDWLILGQMTLARSASANIVPKSSASRRLAPRRMAFLRSAPVRSAPTRIAASVPPSRVVPRSLALRKLAVARSAPKKSARVKSARASSRSEDMPCRGRSGGRNRQTAVQSRRWRL